MLIRILSFELVGNGKSLVELSTLMLYGYMQSQNHIRHDIILSGRTPKSGLKIGCSIDVMFTLHTALVSTYSKALNGKTNWLDEPPYCYYESIAITLTPRCTWALILVLELWTNSISVELTTVIGLNYIPNQKTFIFCNIPRHQELSIRKNIIEQIILQISYHKPMVWSNSRNLTWLMVREVTSSIASDVTQKLKKWKAYPYHKKKNEYNPSQLYGCICSIGTPWIWINSNTRLLINYSAILYYFEGDENKKHHLKG